jgi:hypothetical protein
MLLKAAEAFQNGIRPPAADDPQAYAQARGGYYTTTEEGDWLALHRAALAQLRRPRVPA